MKRILAIITLILYSSFILPGPSLAYLPFKQTDWSGGAGQQEWKDPTKFKEYYHVDYLTTKGQVTIPGNDTWMNPNWKYRRKIEIDNTEQGELDHFPVLVVLEHKVNIDYKKTQGDTGNDLRFTDEDGKTVIPHDIERWDQGGKSYIWVKIPKIADHKKDYFYMYYGNPEAIDARSPGQVWDNKFAAVYNLNETPSHNGKYSDSTRAGRDGKLSNTQNATEKASSSVVGKIDKAQEFGFTNQVFVDLPTIFNPAQTNLTVTAWVNYQSLASGANKVILQQEGSSGRTWLGRTPTSLYTFLGGSQTDGTTRIEENTWYHVAVTFDGTNVKLYLNGNVENTAAKTMESETGEFRIGQHKSLTDAGWDGIIDAVQFSSVARSQDWIKAEYLTGANAYLKYSNEELFGGELISSVFNGAAGKGWGYLSYTATEPSNTAIKIKARTGNDRYLADALDFSVCDSITNKTDISTNNCVQDFHKYIQYQVTLDSTEINKTPILKDIAITDYLPQQTRVITTKGGISAVKGASIVNQAPTGAWPSPSHLESSIYNRESTPLPAPNPSPSPNQLEAKKLTPGLNPVTNFFEALFH